MADAQVYPAQAGMAVQDLIAVVILVLIVMMGTVPVQTVMAVQAQIATMGTALGPIVKAAQTLTVIVATAQAQDAVAVWGRTVRVHLRSVGEGIALYHLRWFAICSCIGPKCTGLDSGSSVCTGSDCICTGILSLFCGCSGPHCSGCHGVDCTCSDSSCSGGEPDYTGGTATATQSTTMSTTTSTASSTTSGKYCPAPTYDADLKDVGDNIPPGATIIIVTVSEPESVGIGGSTYTVSGGSIVVSGSSINITAVTAISTTTIQGTAATVYPGYTGLQPIIPDYDAWGFVEPSTTSSSINITISTAATSTTSSLPYPTNTVINEGPALCFSDYNGDGEYAPFSKPDAQTIVDAFCKQNYVLGPGNTYEFVEAYRSIYASMEWAKNQNGCGKEEDWKLGARGCRAAFDTPFGQCKQQLPSLNSALFKPSHLNVSNIALLTALQATMLAPPVITVEPTCTTHGGRMAAS